MKSRFLIAAPSSNSGKTTLTLGLLRLLHNRGLQVQPFKCGPDYIDTKHHTAAAVAQSINLDTFMMSHDHVQSLFHKYNADISIVEGVMGLFDGADRMKGSSAEIAILLDLPVILVINAKAMAYSVAPLLYGFKHFNPAVNIAGVIFNCVNTASHYQFLKEACEDIGVEPLGYVPVNENIKIPSRHLGLNISEEYNYDNIADHISKTINVDRLLEITGTTTITPPTTTNRPQPGPLKIAIAKDEAFNFTYYENIEILKQLGEVTFFSPIHDTTLPEADLLYLAGGYPELYLEVLSGNTQMREKILNYCNDGGRVIAECGGMMYLGESITDREGISYPMAGFLDITTSMEQAKLTLGYRTVTINNNILKGHEFHYSTYKEHHDLVKTGTVQNAKGINVNTPIYQQKNVTASYIHFYWGEHQSNNALDAFLSTLNASSK
ncbi:hydrogenobyrinic acid a,c-diamide synthase (glutamine-hydrolysing) /cobyrinate a,c-diamide synthase [Chitinophaga sp. YR573]|uniref:cobyrinate a,c-diamide synthase n=1 Tax=Chitinophaga sp. YR573 TaxID=1881040 RepID=UPI0008BDCB9A|nr:cobyrinate a,c-diamide synthase [Chitinophaga sp. YR573]SEW39317.1 hydrogenobyrinic acid a,c-diamide synthase (glutamine-hydrolysing) /cobyrinate a,c-diamide synthase [Chitinophaga sp. YR573]